MTRYILDTDMLTLFARGHPKVVAEVTARRAECGIATTTIEEQIDGRQSALRRARTPADYAHASEALAASVVLWASFEITTMSVAGFAAFERLRRMRLNVGSNDLRIAAVALTLQATVVTRNTRDFARVPNLPLADWAA